MEVRLPNVSMRTSVIRHSLVGTKYWWISSEMANIIKMINDRAFLPLNAQNNNVYKIMYSPTCANL